MKIIFTVLLIIFCSFNLFAQSSINKEDYAVYAAVMNEIYARNVKHNETYAKNSKDNEIETSFVILDNTVESNETTLANNLKGIDITNYLDITTPPDNLKTFVFDELLKNLKESSKNPAKLDGQLPLKYKYSYIGKSELDKLFEEGRKEEYEAMNRCKCVFFGSSFTWQPFFRKYKTHELSSFSKIGFSSDGKFALVFLKIESGSYGSSTFYVLKKAKDNWEVRKNFGSTWVS